MTRVSEVNPYAPQLPPPPSCFVSKQKHCTLHRLQAATHPATHNYVCKTKLPSIASTGCISFVTTIFPLCASWKLLGPCKAQMCFESSSVNCFVVQTLVLDRQVLKKKHESAACQMEKRTILHI